MNSTIKKFNYPSTLLKDYKHWVVLLRPQQTTLGSLVLACKKDAKNMADISVDAYKELAIVTKEIEETLSLSFNYEKINYLCLMMIDKHVHFHVIPRYSSTKNFDCTEYQDLSWPGPPNLLFLMSCLKSGLVNYICF